MDNLKRYAWSSLITFLAGVALVITPEITNLTPDSFRDGTILGLLFAGGRLGIKMVVEMFLAWYNSSEFPKINFK